MSRFAMLLAMLALAGCSLLHSPPAAASTLTVTWDNPTTNSDGSPLDDTVQGKPEALQTWRIEYGTCSAPGVLGTVTGQFIRTRATNGPSLTTASNNLPPGNYCVRAFVANFAGKESGASNTAAKLVDPSTPSPVTNVR